MMRRTGLGIITLLMLAGCVATSPEGAAEEALGGEVNGVDPGPFHRPGQPCLTCHSAEHSPGELEYAVAGTVFNYADDARGLGGVEVVVTDKEGSEFIARTNSAGNFFVTTGGDRGGAGGLSLSSELRYPLRVSIRRDGVEQTMQGLIWRNSSCADCHRGDPGKTSNGPIYLRGVTP